MLRWPILTGLWRAQFRLQQCAHTGDSIAAEPPMSEKLPPRSLRIAGRAGNRPVRGVRFDTRAPGVREHGWCSFSVARLSRLYLFLARQQPTRFDHCAYRWETLLFTRYLLRDEIPLERVVVHPRMSNESQRVPKVVSTDPMEGSHSVILRGILHVGDELY